MYRIINIAWAGPIADAPSLSSVAISVANFVTSLIAGIAIIVIVLAGIMYMTSSGDESRVRVSKKALIAGIVGLVVALLAFSIVVIVDGLV